MKSPLHWRPHGVTVFGYINNNEAIMNSIAEINPSIAESVEQAEAIRTSMQMKLDEMRRAYHKAPNPSLAER